MRGVNFCTMLCFVVVYASQVCNSTSDRKHADATLERYVTETVMSIVTTFFSSPFSDQSTSLQVTVARRVYVHPGALLSVSEARKHIKKERDFLFKSQACSKVNIGVLTVGRFAED